MAAVVLTALQILPMVVLAEELQEILATLTIVIIMVVALLKQVAAQVELKLVLH